MSSFLVWPLVTTAWIWVGPTIRSFPDPAHVLVVTGRDFHF